MTMTDTEAKALVSIDPKALEHACLCAGRSVHHFDRMGDDLPLRASIVAHARAIERFDAFRQEVSDELAKLGCWPDTVNLHRFILPAPDPLVEYLVDVEGYFPRVAKEFADRLRLATREGKIVWEAGE